MNHNTNYTPGQYFDVFPNQSPCFNPPPQSMPCHKHKKSVIEIDSCDIICFLVGYIIAKNCK